MNGAHDLGGMHGLGPVSLADGEAFHHDWERRVLGLRQAMMLMQGAPPNLDEARYAVEQTPPERYLSAGYYERWLEAGERIFVRRGLLTEEELETRRREISADTPLVGKEDPERVDGVLATIRRGFTSDRVLDTPPRFGVGDAVVTRNVHTTAHTRLPRYVRGRHGTIDSIYAPFDLPELAAVGEPRPEHLYSVAFDAAELWGDSAEPNTRLLIQLWESYLLSA